MQVDSLSDKLATFSMRDKVNFLEAEMYKHPQREIPPQQADEDHQCDHGVRTLERKSDNGHRGGSEGVALIGNNRKHVENRILENFGAGKQGAYLHFFRPLISMGNVGYGMMKALNYGAMSSDCS